MHRPAGDVGPRQVRKNPLRVTPGISSMLLRHSEYLGNLSLWKKYLVYRYTLGSSAANFALIGDVGSYEIMRWAYKFFECYNLKEYGIEAVEEPFRSAYRRYFASPRDLYSHPRESGTAAARQLLSLYIREFQRIILNSPELEYPIVVWKATNPYPGLPMVNKITTPIDVPQNPFNSTSYDPEGHFYGHFVLEDSHWALLRIAIPRGSHVLSVNPSYHADPYEREVVLPHSCNFQVFRSDMVNMSYISDQEIIHEFTQGDPPYVIGEIRRPKPGVYYPSLSARKMHLLTALYEEPE